MTTFNFSQKYKRNFKNLINFILGKSLDAVMNIDLDVTYTTFNNDNIKITSNDLGSFDLYINYDSFINDFLTKRFLERN